MEGGNAAADTGESEEIITFKKRGVYNRACLQCANSKKKCSGNIPCDRCRRLGLVCLDKVKRKRAPRDKGKQANEEVKRQRRTQLITTGPVRISAENNDGYGYLYGEQAGLQRSESQAFTRLSGSGNGRSGSPMKYMDNPRGMQYGVVYQETGQGAPLKTASSSSLENFQLRKPIASSTEANELHCLVHDGRLGTHEDTDDLSHDFSLRPGESFAPLSTENDIFLPTVTSNTFHGREMFDDDHVDFASSGTKFGIQGEGSYDEVRSIGDWSVASDYSYDHVESTPEWCKKSESRKLPSNNDLGKSSKSHSEQGNLLANSTLADKFAEVTMSACTLPCCHCTFPTNGSAGATFFMNKAAEKLFGYNSDFIRETLAANRQLTWVHPRYANKLHHSQCQAYEKKLRNYLFTGKFLQHRNTVDVYDPENYLEFDATSINHLHWSESGELRGTSNVFIVSDRRPTPLSREDKELLESQWEKGEDMNTLQSSIGITSQNRPHSSDKHATLSSHTGITSTGLIRQNNPPASEMLSALANRNGTTSEPTAESLGLILENPVTIHGMPKVQSQQEMSTIMTILGVPPSDST